MFTKIMYVIFKKIIPCFSIFFEKEILFGVIFLRVQKIEEAKVTISTQGKYLGWSLRDPNILIKENELIVPYSNAYRKEHKPIKKKVMLWT